MKRSTTASAFIAAGLLALTGCGPETADLAEPGSATSESDHEITIENIQVDAPAGYTDIHRASIVCVDGSAFLYVYSGRENSRQGGPSIERFAEQDSNCNTDPAKTDDSTKETK